MNPDNLTREELAEKLELVEKHEQRFADMAEQLVDLRREIQALEAENEQLREQLDAVREEATLAQAQTPEQQQNKLANVKAVLRYAVEDANGGMGGVKVTTGEATAAIDGSRSTALRLMDEIGGTFSWATVENPGGPKPKELRLAINGRSLSDLLSDVHATYADGEVTA